jgi:hypothetical protein
MAETAKPEERFLVWLGFAHTADSDTLKVYYNLKSRLSVMADVVKSGRGASADMTDVLVRLAEIAVCWAQPIILCLETTRSRAALRLKLYCRTWGGLSDYLGALREIGLIGCQGDYLRAAAAVDDNLRAVPRFVCFGLAEERFSFNACFELARHVSDDAAAEASVIRVLSTAQLPASPYYEVLDRVRAASLLDKSATGMLHTSVTLGFDRAGMRVTTYFQPQWLL